MAAITVANAVKPNGAPMPDFISKLSILDWLLGVTTLNAVGAYWLLFKAYKKIERLEKQIHYSKVRVVRTFQNGRMVSEHVYPVDDFGVKGDKALEEILGEQPGTRITEINERGKS